MRKHSSIIKAVRYAGGLFVALVIGLAPLGTSLPPAVKADTNPVDLELGGEGATSWNITNIKPTDYGTKTVELRNVGSKDGFITIWVSDIVSSEGLNPESENGDTSEPGELDDHLLLDLSADNLSTNLNLPATINTLPRSVTSSRYIEVTPLKAGAIANLQWQWELPAQTGNDVQGDSISFTINYLLRECKIIDVSSFVTSTGNFTQDVTAQSDNNKGKLTIIAGTTGKTAANQPLSDIWLIEMDKEPLPPVTGKINVSLNYEAGPEGTTFDQPITITLTYNPDDIPEGVREEQLCAAVWDKSAGQWVRLDNYTVDTANNTISALITHFSRYSVQSPIPLPPQFAGGGDETTGTKVKPGAKTEVPPTTGALLEVSILDSESTVEIGEDGTLSEALTLTDPDGDFIIDIDSGTRVTGPGGVMLSRIVLRTTDKRIAAPDNIVLLSPTYELVGYTADMEAVPVVFEPPASLTIRYDPWNLPENSFLPFVATYTDEQGFARLDLPPDSLVETGRAKALVSDETLFVVAAELAPPPPPLPARFEATSLIIDPLESFVGETVTISITIANEGATGGSLELHLIIDGIVRAIEEVTLSAQSSETLTFEVSNLATGSHQVKIAGLTGEFKIARMAVSVEETKFNWLLLDIIVGAALAIGAIVLYFLIRRAHRTRLAMAEKEEITFRDE